MDLAQAVLYGGGQWNCSSEVWCLFVCSAYSFLSSKACTIFASSFSALTHETLLKQSYHNYLFLWQVIGGNTHFRLLTNISASMWKQQDHLLSHIHIIILQRLQQLFTESMQNMTVISILKLFKMVIWKFALGTDSLAESCSELEIRITTSAAFTLIKQKPSDLVDSRGRRFPAETQCSLAVKFSF